MEPSARTNNQAIAQNPARPARPGGKLIEPEWQVLQQRFVSEFSARSLRVEHNLSNAAGSFDASVARTLSALDQPLSSVNRNTKAVGKSTVVKAGSVASASNPGDRG